LGIRKRATEPRFMKANAFPCKGTIEPLAMLTLLEDAVVDMLLDRPGEPYQTIRQQLSFVTVSRREFTGVGFFTHFVLSSDAPVRRDLPNMELGDVGAEFPGVNRGAGFLLFVRDGIVSMLEGYTYDENWPENMDRFRVFRHPNSNS
jgi:hypothetical protein